MEKAILKTLAYASIFDYPLTFREIHRWMIGKKTDATPVEKKLGELIKSGKVGVKKGFYFLKGEEKLVKNRVKNLEASNWYFKKIKIISQIFKVIPWIKLVGVSGGLSMENASFSDDIDLFLITSKKRLWISRILVLGILEVLGQRRKRGDLRKQSAGKICCNLILEEDNLEQQRKNLYVAHEVLQMKVLWQREGVYFRYLKENSWAFEFLPNWVEGNVDLGFTNKNLGKKKRVRFFDWLEEKVKIYQLKVMGRVLGKERIEEGGVYFHPEDYQVEVLKKYRLRRV